MSVRVHDGKIVTQVLGTPRYNQFDTEYDLLVWLYEKIRDAASSSIEWFESHKEAFHAKAETVRTETSR